MKKLGTLKNLILIISALIISVVSLWVVFYFITVRNVRTNMIEQAVTSSDAILSRIEEELLMIDDTAYELSHYDRISEMLLAKTPMEFFDNGCITSDRAGLIIGDENPADNVVVFNNGGLFYRFRGNLSNTSLKKVYSLLENGKFGAISIQTNGMNYIGNAKRVTEGNETIGYVVLLMDRTHLDKIFSDYSNLEYLRITLSSDDKVLCSNFENVTPDFDNDESSIIFYKEREIGLSGLKLSVFCMDSIPPQVVSYFRISLPITVLILVIILILFILFLKKRMFDPKEKELIETRMKAQEAELSNEKTINALLKKQISAHFTVNTMNAVRALINKGEKAKATEMCDEFSRLLRYANAAEENISLMEEYYILEQYAGIMQKRYPGRFTFFVDIDDSYENIFIPRMLLQPIVENAILHGIRDKGGKVSLDTEVGDDLIIRIRNTGSSLSEAELTELKENLRNTDKSMEGLTGVALSNIQRRIRMLCGEKYGISVELEDSENVFTVILRKDLEMHKN